MVDRSDTTRNNTTSYTHPQETNLLNVHKAMDYNSVGQPVLRTVGGDIYNSINLPAGMSDVHKFGAVREMSVNTTGTIWDRNDTIYPWATVDAGITVTVQDVLYNNEASIQTGDDGGTVTIIGLDGDYEPAEETVTLSSGTATGSQTFKRIFRAYFTAASGFNPNTNRILIKTGSTVVAQITENVGQTLMAIYTVPAGKTAYLLKGDTTVAANADATINMFVRYGGVGSFRIGHTAEVAGVGGQYTYDFPIPNALPEKTDIDVRATVRSNNARVTAVFDLLFVDN